VSHRINLIVATPNAALQRVLRDFEATVRDEALVVGELVIVSELGATPVVGFVAQAQDLEGEAIALYLRAVS
jgi:hypothetical protein